MATKSDTKTHILDVAEKHFAREGFAATSLRAIIKDAGVNVAAIAYHFGTKEELYQAVTERFAAPVVVEQLKRLNAELSRDNATLEDVLRAFYEPPLELIKKMGKKGETLSMFLSRAHTEPEPIYSLVDSHYAHCRNLFIQAFRRLLPGLSEAEYQWRFEFMLSLIVCYLTRHKPVRLRYTKETEWKPEDVAESPHRFLLERFEQGTFLTCCSR